MGDCSDRLDARIRRLAADTQANNDWRRLKFEIARHGGRWTAETGMVFELKDGAIDQHTEDDGEGVVMVTITALDAPVPFVAELHLGAQGLPPDKRAAFLRNPDIEAQAPGQTAAAPLQRLSEAAARDPDPATEIIHIMPGDWRSKIARARWVNPHEWKRHLERTADTLRARRRDGVSFDPDLICPGDTFEVVP